MDVPAEAGIRQLVQIPGIFRIRGNDATKIVQPSKIASMIFAASNKGASAMPAKSAATAAPLLGPRARARSS